MTQLPTRDQVPTQETWDLSLLFSDQAEFEAAVESLKQKVEQFHRQYKGHLTDVELIIQSLNEYEEIEWLINHIRMYASLGYEVDKTNSQYEENAVRLGFLLGKLSQGLSFYHSELSAISTELLEQVKSTPEGALYQYFIDEIIRYKDIRLDPAVEDALSYLSGNLYHSYALYGATKFQDMTFDDFEVDGKVYMNSFNAFEGDYEGHPDFKIRHASWDAFHQSLARYQHTLASNYINRVQTEKKMATLRGFDSVIDYLLFDQKVTRDSYNQIIDTLTKDFAPVMQRYATLLAKEHGLEKVSLADIKMPFTKGESNHITIEQSEQMLLDAFQVMGDEYLAIFRQAFAERWIDYPMNQTKSTGGFCSTSYQGPSYILLNWTGLLSEVLVLAHELGHAGHFVLQYRDQLAITPEPSMYFVEAPSTCNEVIMCQYLLAQDIDDRAKRSLITEFISRTYFHNMVTHLLEADFQRKVYQAVDREDVLNAAVLNQFFKETLENFWQGAVEINPGAELTWMRQPHYHMGLYPYTYSAGLTIGTQMGQRIAKGETEAIKQWLDVLKAGGTLSPLELAQAADVDMSTPEALHQTIAYVDSLLDQVESLA